MRDTNPCLGAKGVTHHASMRFIIISLLQVECHPEVIKLTMDLGEMKTRLQKLEEAGTAEAAQTAAATRLQLAEQLRAALNAELADAITKKNDLASQLEVGTSVVSSACSTSADGAFKVNAETVLVLNAMLH